MQSPHCGSKSSLVVHAGVVGTPVALKTEAAYKLSHSLGAMVQLGEAPGKVPRCAGLGDPHLASIWVDQPVMVGYVKPDGVLGCESQSVTQSTETLLFMLSSRIGTASSEQPVVGVTKASQACEADVYERRSALQRLAAACLSAFLVPLVSADEAFGLVDTSVPYDGLLIVALLLVK